jgi:hypothetical protein
MISEFPRLGATIVNNLRSRWIALGVALMVLAGCGKFQPPAIPEAVTPDVVASLAASATQNAVILSWSSPSKDRRDKTLKSLEGYRVERKAIRSSADIDASTFALMDERSGFRLVGELEDQSLANLDQLKDRARLEGKPVRRVRADSGFTSFRFEDTDIKVGDHFVYRVVPVNEYGFGRVSRLARVVFRGAGSDITYPEPEEVDEDLGFDPFS